MHAGRIVLAQLMDFLPTYEFQRCVQRYQGNRRVRSFSCLDQVLCMAFSHECTTLYENENPNQLSLFDL